LPLSCDEEFLARVQRYGRAQVPVLIRWKHKLEAGEVLSVHIYFTQKSGHEGFRKDFDSPTLLEWFEYLYNEIQKREQQLAKV